MIYIVKKHIHMKATPEKVWKTLTNPEKTKKYFFGCRVFSDWKEGSTITFKGKIFFFWPIEMKGEILKIQPNRLLKYTLQNGKETSSSTVTDVLSYAAGKTTLSISDDVGQGEGAEKRWKRSEKGWNKVLKGLKKVVEKET